MFLALICAVFLLSGCAGQGHDSDLMQFDHIVTKRCDYYLNGPQQASPPDGHFDEGTRIRLVSPAGDFCRVQSASGIEAFIDAAAIGDPPSGS